MNLVDRLVWITGASSGIGRAMAEEFARRGSRVALSARRNELLEEVRRGLGGRDDHLCVPLDVTDLASVFEAADRIRQDAGLPDVVVLNAGIGQRSKVVQTDPDVERRIMDVNFFGATNVAHAVLPAMVERNSGRIAVMSSIAGKIAPPGHATYAASKHALHGWFEGLRAELYGTDVGITMICPGWIRTDISVHSLKADGEEYGRMDAIHRDAMPVETLARKAVNAVERGRAEAHIGGLEARAPIVKRLFPGLVRKFLPRILK
ncbi:MAG: SDR family NAD(P)-dependent oxidoreductase [Rhodothermales bacterium]|nr:SDR family NAD(P)-dependent oxidoreductase [Rhodothermales bacterium]